MLSKSMLAAVLLLSGLPPTAAAQQPDGLALTTKFVDGIILVQGRFGGETGWWMLDTGFDYSIVDAGLMSRTGQRVSEASAVAQPGGAVEARWTRAVTLDLAPGTRFSTDSAAVIDLSGLAPVVGEIGLGILGHDFFERFPVRIDYAARSVTLLPPGHARPAAPEAIAVPLWLEQDEPFALGYLWAGGRTVPAKLKIDTGSLSGLGLNGSFVHQVTLLPDDAPILRMSGVAMGGEVEHVAARLDSMQLGVTTIRAPVAAWSTSLERIGDAGTLGAAILSRFTVTFDYANHTMWLEPQPEASREEAWDAAGFLVVQPPGQGMVVAQVMPATPAAEAGIEAGDVILRVNDTPAGEMTLEQMRQWFRQPGRTDEVHVQRAGESAPRVIRLRQRRLP